ncbi:thiamine pyrophosphate-binding protein [Corallococcus sp. CA053C]|uniref:thiamine pyrophosphate-binding protein n=1 Tax=Corallococcus sp. CA053C TaxID=2316732 RepID=UPI000EA2E574|nr:thiamine pyrophosphate-binding protein [Corallococcus sp. CA053C]RKH09837.1 thiamine pyrophosphate-binding protein [Corallococcus sp. CA053C]
MKRSWSTGSDIFVELLVRAGIERAFAVTGGAVMDFVDALEASPGLELQCFQTEQGAAWAAMGYTQVTGKLCAVTATSGPGATNFITPLSDALRDNIPLLVVTGQVARSARNTDAFQEIDITVIAASVAKKVVYLERMEDAADVLADAIRVAFDGRPGPVLIDFPKDLQQQACAPLPPRAPAVAKAKPRPMASGLEEVVASLRHAERPVIIAGRGVVIAEARSELLALLEAAPIPVVHTLPGKAALSSTHPHCHGMIGMHGFYVPNWIVDNADLVISLGSRFDDRITGDTKRFAPNARRLIHFDIAQEQVQKVMPERKLGVVGHLKETLGAFTALLEGKGLRFTQWHERIAAVREEYPSTYKVQPGTLQAQLVLEQLNAAVRAHRAKSGQRVIFTTEVGSHQMWASQYLELQPGDEFLTSSGLGCMGSGLPLALGAQIANPDALVICIAGDGSLRFSEAELETAWERALPVKVVLFNNDGYGIVRMWNNHFYEGRTTGVIKQVKQWTTLARGNGFTDGHVDRVESPGALRGVLDRAVAHRGPHFLEMVTPYEDCLPLIPSGKSFKEIML